MCLFSLFLVCELNHNVTNVIPESGLLIMLGFILGGIVWGADKAQTFKLIPVNFFYYLLPQIVLDASYCMPNKLFFSNLGAILVHAIIGTCWNAGTVGIALWACYEGGAMGKSEFYNDIYKLLNRCLRKPACHLN